MRKYRLHGIHNSVKCPACAGQLNAYEATRAGSTPKPQDLTICGFCGAVLQYVSIRPRVELVLVSQETLKGLEPEEARVLRAALEGAGFLVPPALGGIA